MKNCTNSYCYETFTIFHRNCVCNQNYWNYKGLYKMWCFTWKRIFKLSRLSQTILVRIFKEQLNFESLIHSEVSWVTCTIPLTVICNSLLNHLFFFFFFPQKCEKLSVNITFWRFFFFPLCRVSSLVSEQLIMQTGIKSLGSAFSIHIRIPHVTKQYC